MSTCHAQFALAANESDMKKALMEAAVFFGWREDLRLGAKDGRVAFLAMDLDSVYDEEKENLVLPSGKEHDSFESAWLDNFFPPSDYWFKLERAGDTYILLWEIWGVNSSAIQAFEPLFESFPKGKYGFAFAFTWDFEPELVCINADSEVFTGGGTAPECLGDLDYDYLGLDERRSILNRKHWRLKDMAEETDLNQVAMAMALRRWRNGDGKKLYNAIDIAKSASDHQSLGPSTRFKARTREHGHGGGPGLAGMKGSESIEAIPSEIIRKIKRNVESLLCRFPFECEVTGQGYQGRNANIEHLVPGAAVRLKSDWKTTHFNVVGIAVYDSKGRRLANLGGYLNPSDIDRITIACLLPYIKATAIDVSPLGAAVDGRRKQGQFTLHLEVVPIDLPSVLKEVRDLLSSDIEDRTRSSIMPE